MSNKVTPSQPGVAIGRKRSMFADLLSGNSKGGTFQQSLDPGKFEALMSLALTFEETSASFTEFTNNLKNLLNVEVSQLWLINSKEHQLYTYNNANGSDELPADNKNVAVFKPMVS